MNSQGIIYRVFNKRGGVKSEGLGPNEYKQILFIYLQHYVNYN